MAVRATAYATVLLITATTVPGAHAHPPLAERGQGATAAIEDAPQAIRNWLNRADIYRRAGLFHDAMHDIARAKRLDPASFDAELLHARVLFDRERDRAALVQIDHALSIFPKHHMAWLLRGKLNVRLGNDADAVSDFREALRHGDSIVAYDSLGSALRRLGRWADVESVYGDGHTRTGNAVLRRRWIDALLAQKKFKKAIAAIDESIVRSPVRTDWLLLRARALSGLGQHERAIADRQTALKDARRLLRIRPSGTAWAQVAFALSALGRSEESRDAAERSLAMSPYGPESIDMRGLMIEVRP